MLSFTQLAVLALGAIPFASSAPVRDSNSTITTNSTSWIFPVPLRSDSKSWSTSSLVTDPRPLNDKTLNTYSEHHPLIGHYLSLTSHDLLLPSSRWLRSSRVHEGSRWLGLYGSRLPERIHFPGSYFDFWRILPLLQGPHRPFPRHRNHIQLLGLFRKWIRVQ